MLLGLASGLLLLPAVQASSRDVTVGQLVRSPDSDLMPSVRHRVVLRLPADRLTVRLPSPAVLQLVRRAVPDRDVRAQSAEVTFLSSRPPARLPSCKALVHAVSAGHVITRDDVTEAACGRDDEVTASLDHGSGLLVAARDLEAGAPLGRAGPFSDSAISRGKSLTLRSRVGPVTIERPVTTLQAARAGDHVFVRDDAGSVFAASLKLESGQ